VREGFVVSELAVTDGTCTCTAVASAEADFFDGHFPGDPVLPAVAQLSGLVEPVAQRAWPSLGALQRASQLKFHRVCRPGETLALRCEREGRTVRFTLHVGDTLASAGALTFGGDS
jgi:3-hydroxyacyl-[acyl-carrier-protein] dehydratase